MRRLVVVEGNVVLRLPRLHADILRAAPLIPRRPEDLEASRRSVRNIAIELLARQSFSIVNCTVWFSHSLWLGQLESLGLLIHTALLS
jgi:hypothetical protein